MNLFQSTHSQFCQLLLQISILMNPEKSFFYSILSWLLYICCAIQILALIAVLCCNRENLVEVEKAFQPTKQPGVSKKFSEAVYSLSNVRKRKK